MKRGIFFPVLVALVAGAIWWLEAKRSAPASAAPSTVAAAAPDAKRAEREALFGAEALAPDVQWRQSGLGYKILAEGSGPAPSIGARAQINYTGRLKDGTVFDQSKQPKEMPLSGVLSGLSTGLQLMHPGGKAVFFIPPELGYGSHQVAGIAPNSGLIFDVELIAVSR
jgi:FKBP-type peptidyl-prolyl cis-trans isomerase